MGVLELTDENFENEILLDNKLSLVDFWAPWCGPCRMLTPVIEELAEELKDKIKIGKVNIDDNPVLQTKYKINTIPSILLIKNKKVVETLLGAKAKNFYLEAIERYLF